MSKRFDVLSPRPKKDGGTFWHRVGTAFEGEKGISITFDSLPLPDAEGKVRVSLFEPRENSAPRQRVAGSSQTKIDLNDDVPF